MKIKIYTLLLLALFAVQTNVSAQEERNAYLEKSSLRGMEYQIKGGFSIGGVSPIPLPAEIRSIDSYNPTFLVALEGNATKWFSYKWGMTVGIRLEDKGMKTDAKVKNYNMVMTTADQGYLEGAWTGNVKTKVRNSYLTFPVLASYKISPRWVLRGGLPIFVVKRKASEFSGFDHYYGIGGMYGVIGGMGWGEMYASAKYLNLLNETGRNDWREDSYKIVDAQIGRAHV